MRRQSALLAACGIAAAFLIWRLILPLMPALPATAALLPPALVLAAMIISQTLARFVTATFDPTAGRENRFLVVNQRVITNTVGQLLLFTCAVLALEALHVPGVASLGVVFALARLAFWAGYLAVPMFRAPGMAATAALNGAALLLAVWNWLE